MESFIVFILNSFIANLAIKKRIQKRGQVTPFIRRFQSRSSDTTHSAPSKSDIHSIFREEKRTGVVLLENDNIPPLDDVLKNGPHYIQRKYEPISLVSPVSGTTD